MVVFPSEGGRSILLFYTSHKWLQFFIINVLSWTCTQNRLRVLPSYTHQDILSVWCVCCVMVHPDHFVVLDPCKSLLRHLSLLGVGGAGRHKKSPQRRVEERIATWHGYVFLVCFNLILFCLSVCGKQNDNTNSHMQCWRFQCCTHSGCMYVMHNTHLVNM